MQSIYTKYLPATNHRGARIKASASGGLATTISYNYEMDADANHMAAAQNFARALKWDGTWIEGTGPDGRSNVYVLAIGNSFTVEVTP